MRRATFAINETDQMKMKEKINRRDTELHRVNTEKRALSLRSLCVPLRLCGESLHLFTALLSIAKRVGQAAGWATRPRQLRHALVWLLILVIFAQPNIVLADALRAATPADQARNMALTSPATTSAHSESSGLDLRSFIPNLSLVWSITRDAFNLVFPFGDEAEASPSAHKSLQPADLAAGGGTIRTLSESPLMAALGFASFAPQGGSQITDAAISRKRPSLNGGRVEGRMRVFEGGDYAINGKFELTSDLFVVGTAAIRANGGSSYGTIINDGGSPSPSYEIRLSGQVKIAGNVHIRADAIALPSDIPTSVSQPNGTRTVNVTSAADIAAIGDWSTVRNLVVNGSNLSVDMPPGNYGELLVNGSSRVNFTAGAYNFLNRIEVSGNSSIKATGAQTITVGQTINLNGDSSLLLGSNTGSGDVKVNMLGLSLALNGNASMSALVRAPNAQVALNGNAIVRGQVIASTLSMNGNTQIIGDSTPPSVEITSPANNSTTTAESITVSGRASDPGTDASGVKRVLVNEVEAAYDRAAGTWTAANVPLNLGQNRVVARAVDGMGNQATAQITVTRNRPPDTTPPTVAITSPANGTTTQAETITVSGTASDPDPNASGIASVKVNGVDAVRNVVAGTWSISNVPLAVGANTITARAVDNAGNASTHSITVRREQAPPPDTQAPKVTITSPANNSTTFDPSITVTGTAVDEGTNASGVARVFVNGVEATYDAGNHTWTAAGIALVDGDNRIVAEAEDRAPARNKGRAEINVKRRVVAAPQLSITNPQAGAVLSSGSITVAGSASSGASDVNMTVKVNGEAATVAGGQFTKTVALAPGNNSITVVATDSLNQTSQTSVTVVSDQTPPAVALSGVPASVQPGGSYTIRADASDNIGIASVDFTVDGRAAGSVTAAPYQFTLSILANAQADQTIVITATVRDLAGVTATDTSRTRVAGPGGVSGYVFDDGTGYGVGGASATIGGGATITTDATGAFNFVSALPSGLIRLAKQGHTPVERSYTVASGGGTSLFDARLTRLSPTANTINGSGGTATGDSGRLQVVFAAGAFTDGTDVRITSVSPQGLINLLPYGWSPVPGAVIDIRQWSVVSGQWSAFPSAARLTISETTGLAENTRLVLVRYDEPTHAWVVVNANLTAGANGALAANLPAAGQYAFLVADVGSTAPPATVVGQPLPSSQSADSALLNSATATAVASPRSSIISAEARSTISFLATAPSKLPSGVAIEASFNETYNLFSQSNPLLVDRPPQDFVLYSYPAATAGEPNRLGAFFIAKPTRFDFTLSQLRTANVHVEIRSGRPADTGVLIGSRGGEVTSDDGAVKLEIPSGALQAETPVFIEEVQAADTGLQLPDGYEVVGAVDIDLSSAILSSGGMLSVPSVAGDASHIVVARLITVGGRRSPKVVARAIEASGKLRSTTSTPTVPAGVSLAGVTVSGRYVFIRVPSAFGYIKGVVTNGASNSAASMVRVSVDRALFVDVTAADGRYLVLGAAGAGSAGSNLLEAASVLTDATGSAFAGIATQDAVFEAAISTASVALAVGSVTPANAAGNCIVTTPITITFNKPITSQSLTGSSFKVTTAVGNPVLGTITVLAGSRVAVFTPSSTLAGSTAYKVTLTTAVLDLYGNALGAQFESVFTTAAVIPVDNRLKPEKVRLSYPNAQGFSTVTIPAGAVPEGSTVVVINNTTGATITTVAGTAEITLQITAQVGDEIVVLVRQPDGTEYRVSQGAYRREDGFTSVGRNGGVVTSEDGRSVLAIPKNAISGQADLKLAPRAESDIPIPRQNEMAPENMAFGAGVEIRAQGTFTVERELHLELPSPANMAEGRRVAFVKPSRVRENNQEVDVWETVTSGRVEGGKFKTSSPPFFGLFGLDAILTIWVFIPVRQRVVLGQVTAPVAQGSNEFTTVPNALCILGDNTFGGFANRLVARTNSEGFYSIFDIRAQNPDSSFVHVIDDVNGRRGVGAPVATVNLETRFLQGLQGFETYRADVVLPASGGGGGGGSTPPQIILFGRSTNGPVEQDPLVQFGVVQLPAAVEIRATTNRPIQDIKGNVFVGSAPGRALSWTPIQTEGQSQIYSALLDVTAEGSYSVVVRGFAVAGDISTSTQVTYNFVASRNPNIRPSLEGPPRVLTTSPSAGALDVDVATDVRIEFSEPVVNLVAGQTVYLQEEGQAEKIGGTILSGGVIIRPDTPNISNITFRPSRSLNASKRYCLNVTTAVVDSNNIALDQEYTGSGDTTSQSFTGCFTTFGGFVLNETPVADQGFRVVITGSFAVTLIEEVVGRSTVNVYDISDPASPALRGSLDLPQRAADIAVSEEVTYTAAGKTFTRIAAVVTRNLIRPEQQANLWIINLDEVERPEIVGVTSLYVPEQLPTSPLSVRIHGDRAFVGNSPYRGVIAVDIAKSIELFSFQSDPLRPVFDAATPNKGFGWGARVQSVRYYAGASEPSVATSVASLSSPTTAADVVFAANTGGKQLVAIYYDRSNDGFNEFSDSRNRGIDDRIFSMKAVEPQDGGPLKVRAAANVLIGGATKSLVLALGGNRLWIFDVGNPSSPTQYTSRTFAEMGFTGGGSASHFEIEGTLAYVAIDDKVVVVDFSDPNNPRVVAVVSGVGSGITGLAVKEGFIFTMSPGSGARDGLNVAIARPASTVFVHGYSPSEPDLLCAAPVIIDRQTRLMKQDAEVFFQIFGQQAPPTGINVIIQRNGQTIANLPAELSSSGRTRVVKGRALWRTNEAINLADAYTAQVVFNTGDFRTKPEPVPFSFLINEYMNSWSVAIDGAQATTSDDRPYFYVLGANSKVTLRVQTAAKLSQVARAVGLRIEDKNTLGEGGLSGGLSPGRYAFTLRAEMSSEPTIFDEVQGSFTVTKDPDEVRTPGHTVIAGVDIFSGNLGLTHTDFEIPNRGLSLSMTRSYNTAAADVFSPLGYGWHHNYQVLLVREGSKIMIRGGDGEGQRFADPAAGQEVKAEDPHQGRLRKNADGSYDFFTKGYVRYHFPEAFEAGGASFFNHAYMGNLDYIEEPHGSRIDLVYDGLQRLAKVTDSSGRNIELTYEQAQTPFVGTISPSSQSGIASTCVRKGQFALIRNRILKSDYGKAWRITKITGPGGLEMQYEYDADGNLFRAIRKGTDSISTPTQAAVWEYGYRPTTPQGNNTDVTHAIKSVKNPNGNTTSYGYDFSLPGLFANRVDYPEAVSNTFNYTLSGGVVTAVVVKDGNGVNSTYTIARAGGSTTETIETSVGTTTAKTVLQFNSLGLKTSERDAEGMVTEYAYDGAGNPSAETRRSPSGETLTTQYEFDPKFGKPLKVTDPRGKVTQYQLNERGDVIKVTLPTGAVTTMTYAANGDLVSVTNERSLTTTYAYDGYGNPTTVTQETEPGKQITATSTYDVRSRVKTSSGTLDPSAAYTYDALDRIVSSSATDPAGFRDAVSATHSYKPMGQVERTVTTGGGQSYTVQYGYDGLERNTSVTESGDGIPGYTRSLTYDKNSNVKTATDRRGVTTTYTYNELNYVTREEVTGPHGPAAPIVESVTDPNLVGNPRSQTDRYGNRIAYEYDGLHRLRKRLFTGKDNEFSYEERMLLDENGNVTAFTDRNQRTTTFTYDALNRPTSVVDAANRRTDWDYLDSLGKVIMRKMPQALTVETTHDGLNRTLSQGVRVGANLYITNYAYTGLDVAVTDPRGVTTSRKMSAFGEVGETRVALEEATVLRTETRYTAFGGRKSFKDANNRTTTFTVDVLGRTTAVRYPQMPIDRPAVTEGFTYDGEGLMVSHTDRRGVVSTMSYDNVGRELAAVTGGISVMRHSYADAARTVTKTDANNHSTVCVYDGLMRLKSLTNADAKTIVYSYDGINLRSQSDFKSKLTQFDYDNVDRLVRVKDRTGLQETTITHTDVDGHTVDVTDRRGSHRVEISDALGRVVSVTVGGQALVSYEYDGNSNRTAMIDGRGNRTAFTYDNANRVKGINRAGIQVEAFSYDGVGNVLSHNDGFGASTAYTYDGLDNLLSETDGVGNTTLFRFDGEGLLVERAEPKRTAEVAYLNTYEYNGLRSLVRVVDAKRGEWVYGYDPAQNLTSVRDALMRVTAYEYDPLDRVKKVIQPQNTITEYDYDENSNRVAITDPLRQRTQLAYDELDRVKQADYFTAGNGLPAEGPRRHVFGYDPEGNITSVQETNAVNSVASVRSYARTYDARGRVTSETDANGRMVRYQYDATNNLTKLTDADQKETIYGHDAVNRLTSVGMSGSRSASYKWKANGLLEQVIYPSGMEREYAYDNADRLMSVKNTLSPTESEEFVYTYDKNSNRASEVRKRNGAVLRSFSYEHDELDRLTKIVYGADSALGYEYDAVGNRLSERGVAYNGTAVNRAYSYNELNRLSTVMGDGAGAITFSYDANGNLRTQTQGTAVTNFEYDVRDQLRRVVSGANEAARFDYDFQRRRLSKTAAGETLSYVYAGDRIVNEYGTTGQLVSRYDYGNDLVRGEIGAEGERYYFADGLGSVTSLAASSGSLAAKYEYDAWGVSYNPPSSLNRVGYTGQRLDGETGLMALGNGERYYSPVLGQFLQQDSLAGSLTTPQSLNRYSYVENNPLIYTDPSGHQREWMGTVGGPLVDPVRDTKLVGGMIFGEKRVRNAEAAIKGAVRGAARRVLNTALETSKLSLDLAERSLGIGGEARSGLMKQYDQYRRDGDSFWGAVGKIATEAGKDVATLGLHGFAGQIGELNKLYAGGEISEEQWWEMAGEEAGGLVADIALARVGGTLGKATSRARGSVGRAVGQLVREGYAAARSGLRSLKAVSREGLAVAGDFARGSISRSKASLREAALSSGPFKPLVEGIEGGIEGVRSGRATRRAAKGGEHVESLSKLDRRLQKLGYDEANRTRILNSVANGDDAVIVGENMRRVNAVASMVKKAGGNARTYNPQNWTGVNRNSLEANRSWLRYWVKEKQATIIDIGRQPTPRPQGPSSLYGLENRSLNKWGVFTPFNE